MAVSYTTLAVDAGLVDNSVSSNMSSIRPVFFVVKNTDGVLTVSCRALSQADAANIAARLAATVVA